jgi:acyl-[acyl carrier protein]--UDP-N-acetylglucosamine O-acyltransferase
MVGGNTRVNSDLPPYFLYTDFNVAAHGLNLVGLKRAGFSEADIKELKAAYGFCTVGLNEQALQRIERESTQHTRHLVSFIRAWRHLPRINVNSARRRNSRIWRSHAAMSNSDSSFR